MSAPENAVIEGEAEAEAEVDPAAEGNNDLCGQ